MTIIDYMHTCMLDYWYEVETEKGVYSVLLTEDDKDTGEYHIPLFEKESFPIGITSPEKYLEYIIDMAKDTTGIYMCDTNYTLTVDVLETK